MKQSLLILLIVLAQARSIASSSTDSSFNDKLNHWIVQGIKSRLCLSDSALDKLSALFSDYSRIYTDCIRSGCHCQYVVTEMEASLKVQFGADVYLV